MAEADPVDALTELKARLSPADWKTICDYVLAERELADAALESYAAEKVAEEQAAIVAFLRGDNGFDNEDGLLIADVIAANQHHGGNDADT